MTAIPESRSILDSPASSITWRKVALVLLMVALIGLAIGLAIVGLDALNDLLARGFTSIGRPSS
jgi:hypothetical protein